MEPAPSIIHPLGVDNNRLEMKQVRCTRQKISNLLKRGGKNPSKIAKVKNLYTQEKDVIFSTPSPLFQGVFLFFPFAQNRKGHQPCRDPEILRKEILHRRILHKNCDAPFVRRGFDGVKNTQITKVRRQKIPKLLKYDRQKIPKLLKMPIKKANFFWWYKMFFVSLQQKTNLTARLL